MTWWSLMRGVIGVTRQAAYYWFDGKTSSIDSPTLLKVAQVLKVRLRWLQSGEGPMPEAPILTDDETQLIEFFRRMSEEDQRAFMKMARTFASDSDKPATRGDPFAGRVPRT
jgi:hypothetical protein